MLQQLLLLCLTNVQLLFYGRFYRQVDGVAMGSPLGPLFANIFMGSIEQKLRVEIETSCLKFFRYVDDNNHSITHLLAVLNSAHPHISFMHEC